MNGRAKRAVLRPLRANKTISFQPTSRAQQILARVKGLTDKTITELMNDAIVLQYGGFAKEDGEVALAAEAKP